MPLQVTKAKSWMGIKASADLIN